jgi:hypothetical protein
MIQPEINTCGLTDFTSSAGLFEICSSSSRLSVYNPELFIPFSNWHQKPQPMKSGTATVAERVPPSFIHHLKGKGAIILRKMNHLYGKHHHASQAEGLTNSIRIALICPRMK